MEFEPTGKHNHTALEDRTLQVELLGYSDFTHQTRDRLVPEIW